MSKDISLTSDGTITARGSGMPEEGGNLNNHIAFFVNPSHKRIGLSTGLGATLAGDVGGGIKLIGSTGLTLKASGNVGVSVDQAEHQHDSRYDVPLRSNAIGFREGRQLANEIVALKGGDIRKYTIGEVEGIVNQYPNLLRPESSARLRDNMGKLEGINTVRVLTPEVTGRIQEIAEQLRDHQGISIPVDAITSVPSLSAADLLRQQPLTHINDVAVSVQGSIASAGGVKSVNEAIAEAAAKLSPGLVTQRAVDVITDTVAFTSAMSNNTTSEYKRIPSVEKVQGIQRQIDNMVRHDPALDVAAFVAIGAKSPDAAAALVIQRAAHAGIGNVDWVAGEGTKMHKANISSTRLEAGVGEGALSFSPDTVRKLNLTVSSAQTSVGGYAFIDKEKINWSGVDGSRKTTTIGLGASISKGLGGGNTGIVSVEAFDSRAAQMSPGNTPSKVRDKGVTVKGQITF